MGFIGSMFGDSNGSGFQASSAKILNPVTSEQAGAAQDSSLAALKQQQDFVNALQGQNGLANQSSVFNQLQGVANGTGPNPALAQLNQSTGNNIANQAALMAGQRGSGANVGMMARQAGQLGGNLQQQAVGQGATLQAQQQLGAMNSLGSMANQQVGQQANAIGGLTGNTQQQQNMLLGGINNQNNANVSNTNGMNSANAAIAQQNASAQSGFLGGALGGLGSAIGAIGSAAGSLAGPAMVAFSQGGVVPGQAEVKDNSIKNDNVPAVLSPGEIVIPRSITQHPDAAKLAAAFVQEQLEKHKINKKQNFYDGGAVADDEETSGQSMGAMSSDAPQETPAAVAQAATPQVEAGMPAAAETAAPMSGAMGSDYLSKLQGDFNKQRADVVGLGKAEAKASTDAASAMGSTIEDIQKNDVEAKQRLHDVDSQRLNFQQAVMDGRIDPNRYLGSMGTGQKVMTAIGLILGGMGSGLTHGPNNALEYLNHQIDRDIEAQKMDLGKKQSLLSANMQQYRNVQDAEAMTKAHMLDIAKMKLQQVGMQSGDPVIKQRALLNADAIGLQADQTIGPMKYKQQIMSMASKGGENADPVTLVQHIVPPAQQAKVAADIGKAKHITENFDQIMKNYDQAEKDVGSPVSHPLYTLNPFVEPPSIKALKASLIPIAHDEIGRVNPEALKAFGELLPGRGEFKSTREANRAAFKNLIMNQYTEAVNNVKAHNIDLSRYTSTNPTMNALSKAGPNWKAQLEYAKKYPEKPVSQAFMKKVGFSE